jgi:pyruvate dehydrogenase complex dehydrogenase (E1) component
MEMLVLVKMVMNTARCAAASIMTEVTNIFRMIGWNVISVRLGITSPAVMEMGRKDLFVNLVFKLMESPHAKLQSSIKYLQRNVVTLCLISVASHTL